MAIATLTGDNGLLTKAGDAKNTANESEIEEKVKLAYEDYYLGQHTKSGYTFQNAIDKMFGTGVATVTESNGVFKVVFTDGKKYTYNGITGEVKEILSQAIETVNKDNYGDYLDLGQSVVGTDETTDDWRILYNDKNGHVYAILADYLPNNNAAVTASGLNSISERTYSVNSSGNNQDLLNKLNNTTAWQSLIPEDLRSSCQVKGATTAEIIIASYNEKYNTNYNYTTDYPYLRTNPNDASSSIDSLYMPRPNYSSNYDGVGYWLSTTYKSSNPNRMWIVHKRGQVTYDFSSYTYFGVCPVVSLPSNIQATKNGTIWTLVQ